MPRISSSDVFAFKAYLPYTESSYFQVIVRTSASANAMG
jgi:hypothetical protein